MKLIGESDFDELAGGFEFEWVAERLKMGTLDTRSQSAESINVCQYIGLTTSLTD